MTKSALLWQSFQRIGANYKTCLGFSRQLLGNVLVCMEKEELGWRIINDKERSFPCSTPKVNVSVCSL